MSKIERLIEELCPDGVEYKTIDSISLKIASGGTPKTSNTGYYGGQIPWLRTQEINFCEIRETGMYITDEGLQNSSAKWIPKNCVILAMYGATVGKVAINKIPLTTNQACCNIQLNEKIALHKYVYYCLSNMYTYIKSLGQGSQSNINAQIVRKLLIPVPPLPIQEEIVRILDSFTEKTNELKAQLEEELEARKKQYEWYRDWLLKPNPTDNIMKLGDCCTIKARIGWQGLTKKEYLDEGDYYLITGTDFKNGQVDFEHCHYVKQERYDQDTNIQIRNSDVLVTKDGTLGKVAFVDNLDKPATLNSGVFVVRGNNSLLDQRYLYHFLKSNYLMSFAKSRITGGTIKHLNQNIMVEVPIFVPTLEKQRKLANILDSFDNICFSFSQGLPAEIDSRQKQYEYYRDKLLTFKRVEKDDREGIDNERV